MSHFDLMILGAGPGGYVAAIDAAKKGLRVVLIEKEAVGGTCLNVGCIPTKALIHDAMQYFSLVKHQNDVITTGEVHFDLEKAVNHKNHITQQLVQGIRFLLDKHGVTTVIGHAMFTSAKSVEVSTELGVSQYTAESVIIATGAQTRYLPIPGINLPGVVDSRGLLQNQNLPKKLVVIGGGIIGMEFAFMYGQLGVEVEVLEFLPQILPMLDKDIVNRLVRPAKEANVSIKTGAEVKEISRNEHGLSIHYLQKNEMMTTEADLVLVAVGRSPLVQGFGLENTGVLYSPKGIPVSKFMETNVPGVYAIGDVNNQMQLAHVASHQAFIAVNHIFGNATGMDLNQVPSVLFTSPQIAWVGPSEIQCKERNLNYRVVKTPFSAAGRSLIENTSTGWVKLLINDADEVFAATVIGEQAEHLIATLTVAITNRVKVHEIQETIFAHPTMSEVLHEAYLGITHEAIHYLD